MTINFGGVPITVDISSQTAATISLVPQVVSVELANVGVPGPQGQQGQPGPPGGGTQIIAEVPSGTKDGVNKVFTMRYAYQAATIAVFRNGIRGLRGYDYTETGATTITFVDAPLTDDAISVDYLVAG